MTLDESVHGMRLRVIERAQALGNVSAVCRELGISRTVFYRWRKRLERHGGDGVHPRRRRAQAGRRSRGRWSASWSGSRSARPSGAAEGSPLTWPDLAGARGTQHRATAAASGRGRHVARAADCARGLKNLDKNGPLGCDSDRSLKGGS
jgi:hypothetical protein